MKNCCQSCSSARPASGVGSMLIYWFNLDNKAIYFLVRPLLDKLYDHRKVDEKV